MPFSVGDRWDPSTVYIASCWEFGLVKLIFFLAALFVSFLAPDVALGGEIQGRVLNAQGGPVAGATVTVTASNKPSPAKFVTATDGSYAIPDLEPGVYTVIV